MCRYDVLSQHDGGKPSRYITKKRIQISQTRDDRRGGGRRHAPVGTLVWLAVDVPGDVGLCMVEAERHVRFVASGPVAVIAFGTFPSALPAGRLRERDTFQECEQELTRDLLCPRSASEVDKVHLCGVDVPVGGVEEVQRRSPGWHFLVRDLGRRTGRGWVVLARARNRIGRVVLVQRFGREHARRRGWHVDYERSEQRPYILAGRPAPCIPMKGAGCDGVAVGEDYLVYRLVGIHCGKVISNVDGASFKRTYHWLPCRNG